MEQLEPGDPETVGPYQLLARLGAGGMGRVYLARSVGGSTVAVKVVRPELGADPQFRDRFRREVAAAEAVSGAWTAPVVGADPAAAVPWLATAYVLGPSLAEAIGSYGPLPPRSLWALGAGLAEALYVIHAAGLAHRDLKPSNVLLAADGPRVIDFGIARAADGDRMTTTGMVVGSPGYMSPEQAAGQRAGPAGDVFCLASVMVFAATGRGPFDSGSATGLLYQVVHGEPNLAGLPPELAAILGPCFAKDSAARPAPGQIAAAFAPQGAAAILGDGWLPSDLAGSIARHAAMVLQMDAPPQATRLEAPTTWPGGTGRDRTGPGGTAAPAGHAARRAPGRRRFLLGSAAGAIALAGGGTAFALAGRHGARAVGGGIPASPAATVKPGPSVSARPSSLPNGVAPVPLWTATLHSPVDTAPVVAGKRVLVKTDNEGLTPFSATMTALDVNSGKQLWVFPGILNEELPPVVIGNFALTLGNERNQNLLVLDLASGEAIKTIAPSGDDLFLSLLAATPTTAYILGSSNKNASNIPYALLAYHLPSGKQLWRQADGNQQINTPMEAVAAGADLISADIVHHVTRRSTVTGAALWNVNLGAGHLAAPNPAFIAVSARRGVAISARSALIGRDLATGAKRWEISGPDPRDTFGPPAVSADGTTVYAAMTGDPGALVAIDARNGIKVWDDNFTDAANHRPALVGAMCFFSFFTLSGQTGVYAIDTGTGAKRWTFTDTSASSNEWWLAGAPAATMLVARHDNTLLALPAVS